MGTDDNPEDHPLYAYFESCPTPSDLQDDFRVQLGELTSLRRFSGITTNFYLRDHLIGFSRHDHYPQRKVAWISFFPYEQIHFAQKRGFHVGTLAHVVNLMYFIADHGVRRECIVLHDEHAVNPVRQRQLARMGVFSGMRLDDYLTRSIAYAETLGFQFTNPFS